MILIKVETQDISTCTECRYSYIRYNRGLCCDLNNKHACVTKIAKHCLLLSRHDLLAKAKELYHQEKLEQITNS